MVAVDTFQPCHSTKSADSNQLLFTPYLPLPDCVCRTCSTVPSNLKKLCIKFLCIIVRYMPGQLCDPCHNRSSGGNVHSVCPARCIINLSETAIGQLSYNASEHAVIVKCPRYNIQTGGIQIFLIDFCKRSKHRLSSTIIQIKTKRLRNIPQVRICLLNQCICDLL